MDQSLYFRNLINKSFESPFEDIISDKEELTTIISKWLEISYLHGNIYDNKNIRNKARLQDICIRSMLFWIPFEIKEWWELYTSVLFQIIDLIQDMIESDIPNYAIDWNTFNRLLMGWYTNKFYAIWEHWRQLLEEVNWLYTNLVTDKHRSINLWSDFNTLTWSYGEIVTKNIVQSISVMNKFYDRIDNGIAIEDEELLWWVNDNIWINETVCMRVSSKGLKYIYNGYSDIDNITKWFEEIEFQRIPIIEPYTLINAVVTSLYSKNDIFLIYYPSNNHLWLYDFNNIDIWFGNVAFILNFSQAVRLYFYTSDDNIIDNIHEDISNINKNNSDRNIKKNKIKAMFENVYQRILSIDADDFTLNIEWSVKDLERFQEINELVPYWEVGFKKHNGEKKVITFQLINQLKKYFKSI